MTAGGYYHLSRGRFGADELGQMEAGVMASPYLGASPLGEEFVDTRGFSIVCRRSALAAVRARFPYLTPFVDRAIFAASNAFYLNPLVLDPGSRVDAHVDCRALADEQLRIIPTLVSVLYVRCPGADGGGTLVFAPDTDGEAELQPTTGDLVHFRGRLVHAVTPLTASEPRLSIVCEQYNLGADALAQFPELAVLSTAPR